MTKLTMTGLVALVLAGIAVTGSIAGSGAEIGACDVNTRGKAYLWARQHPGLSHIEECRKLGAA